MTQTSADFEDIFKGAEKIEILGKLPSFLWAYVEAGKKLINALETKRGKDPESLSNIGRILAVLDSAASVLNNQELKRRLQDQSEMLQRLTSGQISESDFVSAFASGVTCLEGMAGHRRDQQADILLEKAFLDKELDKAEKIKAGRSADIVVSVDILDDVREYLSREVLTEGISSVLVIDSAGSLVVNVGNKIDLDAVSLAAVAAANFAATEQIARLIGERDFVLLFYKGHNESFHFSRVGNDYIIVTIFNNSLSLGLLRLKIAEVAQVLEKKLPTREG